MPTPTPTSHLNSVHVQIMQNPCHAEHEDKDKDEDVHRQPCWGMQHPPAMPKPSLTAQKINAGCNPPPVAPTLGCPSPPPMSALIPTPPESNCHMIRDAPLQYSKFIL